MFERAVRLWAMSPTRATVSPSIRPRRSRIDKNVEQPLRRMFVRRRRRR